MEIEHLGSLAVDGAFGSYSEASGGRLASLAYTMDARCVGVGGCSWVWALGVLWLWQTGLVLLQNTAGALPPKEIVIQNNNKHVDFFILWAS